ncbi:MAG: hypothetical protein AAGF92_03770 [Myxococcota bacterium]
MKVDIDLDALERTTPNPLAAAIPEPEWRERVIRGMTDIALLDDDVLGGYETTASARPTTSRTTTRATIIPSA